MFISKKLLEKTCNNIFNKNIPILKKNIINCTLNSLNKLSIIKPNQIIAYIDGSCSQNPGEGGWAVIYVDKEDKII